MNMTKNSVVTFDLLWDEQVYVGQLPQAGLGFIWLKLVSYHTSVQNYSKPVRNSDNTPVRSPASPAQEPLVARRGHILIFS